ncbi:MAG: hypothetical protein KC940_16560 [Candidatus Omnitrophica bacterium]|nr:hypothetical protein [Candidatus Omnitrophota bacterium]
MTRETAEQSLRDIEEARRKTRFDADWGGGDLMMILWGAVWTFAFLGSHYDPEKAGIFWMIGDALGVIGTWAIIYQVNQRVQSQEGQRIGIFWFLLFVFIFLELAVMHPWDPIQMNAFICLQVMLAIVVMGLWLEVMGMLLFAGVVTAFILVGYFLMGSYYNLWMACTGGGAFLGTGLYARYRLRRS